MTILMLIYAALLPTTLGFLFVAYFSRHDAKRHIIDNIILGYGVGMGFVTFGMFLIGCFQIRFNLFLISSLQISAIILLVILIVRSDVSFGKVVGFDSLQGENNSQVKLSKAYLFVIIVLSVWIVYKMFSVAQVGLTWPIYNWDCFEQYSTGAKFFYYNEGLALDPAGEHFFGKGYRKFLVYPLHTELLQTWFSLCLGNAHEIYMKFYNVLYFISIVSLVFFAVKKEASFFIAILAAFFLSSVPLLVNHATTALADITLSYYTLAVSVCFLRSMQNKNAARDKGYYGHMVLTGTFVALAVWTKLEGWAYCASFTFALFMFLFRRKTAVKRVWSNALPFLIPVATVVIPWFIFLFMNDITFDRPEKFSLTSLHFEVLPVLWEQITLKANFNIIFPFFFVVLMVGAKLILKSELIYLYGVLFAVIIMNLFIYITSENYKWVLQITIPNRSILTYIPIMYYVSALTAHRILNPKSSEAQS